MFSPRDRARQRLMHKLRARNPRHRLYCMQWLRQGHCSFGEIDCKYLHQMPSDEETLNSVGFFNGPPTWWLEKRANGEELDRYRTDEGSTENHRFAGLISAADYYKSAGRSNENFYRSNKFSDASNTFDGAPRSHGARQTRRQAMLARFRADKAHRQELIGSNLTIRKLPIWYIEQKMQRQVEDMRRGGELEDTLGAIRDAQRLQIAIVVADREMQAVAARAALQAAASETESDTQAFTASDTESDSQMTASETESDVDMLSDCCATVGSDSDEDENLNLILARLHLDETI